MLEPGDDGCRRLARFLQLGVDPRLGILGRSYGAETPVKSAISPR